MKTFLHGSGIIIISKKIVVINYSNSTAKCRIRLDVKSEKDSIEIFDEFNDTSYIREIREMREIGLYIELKAYCSHIFHINM